MKNKNVRAVFGRSGGEQRKIEKSCSFSIVAGPSCVELAQFQMGHRGNPEGTLVNDLGYFYGINKKRNSKVYWKCREESRSKCTARAVTHGRYVVSWTNVHNHPPVMDS